jgi:hypothetical protein
VILFSVDVSAAELTSIAKEKVNRTNMGPQIDLPKSLLDFMIAPLVGVTRIALWITSRRPRSGDSG